MILQAGLNHQTVLVAIYQIMQRVFSKIFEVGIFTRHLGTFLELKFFFLLALLLLLGLSELTCFVGSRPYFHRLVDIVMTVPGRLNF